MSRDKARDPREKYKPPLLRELLEQSDDDEAPRRRGRPTKISRKYIQMIAFHVLSGADIKDAALMAGICEKTYYNWRDLGRKCLRSTDPKEQEELALYGELLQTVTEAQANHRGMLDKVTTVAAEKHWQAAAWRRDRLDRVNAMVRARKEKREAEREAAKIAKENATGGVGGFQFYIPTKDDEPADVICAKCNELYDETRACKCTRGSPLQRLKAGEVLPVELLKKLGELVGVEVDEKDPTTSAEKIRQAIGA